MSLAVAAAHAVFQYTAEDMRTSIANYVRQEIWRADWDAGQRDTQLADLVTVAEEALTTLGGGLFWSRVIIHVARSQPSCKGGRRHCIAASDPRGRHFFGFGSTSATSTTRKHQKRSSLATAELLAADEASPLTILEIYDKLASARPDVMRLVDVATIGTLVRTQFAGLIFHVGEQYVMPNQFSNTPPDGISTLPG